MAFRYINPGYRASAFEITVENFIYNPTNGIAFRLSDEILEIFSNTFSRISLPQAFNSDIYGKLNVYFDAPADLQTNDLPSGFYIGANSTYNLPYSPKHCIGIAINNGKAYLCNGSGNFVGKGIDVSSRILYSIWFHLHMTDNSSDSYGELSINNEEQMINFQGISRGYVSSDKMFIIGYPDEKYGGKDFYISEMIISDEFISKDEKIMPLPVSETVTDMTAGANGIYTANEVGQTLLQGIDVVALTRNQRAQTPITGIAVVGVPAYYTSEDITIITALSKSDTTVTMHDTCELDTDTTDVVMVSWGLSGVTIADLQNMQFGWKAGR